MSSKSARHHLLNFRYRYGNDEALIKNSPHHFDTVNFFMLIARLIIAWKLALAVL